MSLTKQEKSDIVEEVSKLLESSKLTVMASYPGTSVKAMQKLRNDSTESGTNVKVIKNRLVIKALEKDDKWKAVDTSTIKGQLLYAFNSDDEVAPAKVLADFAKTNPTLEFIGALTLDGQFMNAEDVKAIAALPTKDQLRGQLVGLLGSPLSGFVNVLAGNIRGVITVLNARADAIK